MKAHSVEELIQSLGGAITVDGDIVTVRSEAALRDKMDDLIQTAVFGEGITRDMARWIIWEAAQGLGIYPASIHQLYMAIGRGDVPTTFTVPAMNIRAMNYNSSRAVFCADDEITMKYLNKENFFGFNIQSKQLPISMKRELPNGAFIKDGDMYVRTGQEFTRMSVFDFALKGKHNQYNTMAACVAATTLDIRKEKIREAVQTFQNFEHRMELHRLDRKLLVHSK